MANKIYDTASEWDAVYCYPKSKTLKNKLGITAASALEAAEREIVFARYASIIKNPVRGDFDFPHLCRIHKALFGDIYVWAGKPRTVNILKENIFCNALYIEDAAGELFTRLAEENRLLETPKEAVPGRLAYYLSEINAIHPFREGNGRTQRVFIEYLANHIGYALDFSGVSAEEMIAASKIAFQSDYVPMEKLFSRILSPLL